MKNSSLWLLCMLFVVFAQNAKAQSISNEGTEFWTVFPTHDPSGGNLATMNVNVTSKYSSEVTVSCGGYSETKPIPANTVVTFLVSRSDSYIDYTDSNMRLTNRGIHIVVSPGRPKVVAYSHVFASARSAATLVLPIESLGQKYYSMNFNQDASNSGQNYLVLIAAEDNTKLLLHKSTGTVTVDLPKAGDVYEYLVSDKEDLTGTFVEVDPVSSPCKRFAAFSGSTSISIGPCGGSRDPLLQQLYTLNSWGKNYGLVPFKERSYVFRVMAGEDQTIVKLNGVAIATLNKGQYYESGIVSAPGIVSADKLISVAQYSLTQACSGIGGGSLIGDPEMVLLNPIEFNIKNITVFSSSKQDIREKYINVFMKTEQSSTFRINGAPPTYEVWQTMPSDPTYSFIQVQVDNESLTLTAADGFNAIAYGFGSFESYAYSAGTNLATNQFLTLYNKNSKLDNLAACVGQANDFKLTVPYQLSKISWNFADGSNYTDQHITAPIVTTQNGTTLYTYTFAINKVFNTIGSESLNAIATVINSTSACISGDLELDFTIDVLELPTPNFTLSTTDVCLGAEVKPIDSSNDPGGAISKWRWQFDNGPFIEEESPSHIFTTGGIHSIRLWVANAGGCWSTDAKEIKLNIPANKIFPKINFQAPPLVCFNDNKIQLAAKETLGLNGTGIYSGNGVNATGLFDPALAGVGIHELTYTFTSVTGCTNSVIQTIEVLAMPIVNGPLTVYILSGGQKAIPITAIGANLKYKWTPAIGLSSDAVLNPIASPEKDTDYQLTVSINGLCEVTLKVTVKVLDQLSPPNSFSPNGDGVNDVWNITSIDSYPNVEVLVFDRGGQKVFQSLGYAKPFDGNYQNKPLPVGVYYYIIAPKNGRKTMTGSLTIIR
ncbi:MAG: gliding motility-associated C-terminal domain-containing protein [Bacteroidota bacterium]